MKNTLSSLKTEIASAKALSKQQHLVIDGVDWTLTERRHRRRHALILAIVAVIWVGVTLLIMVVTDGTWTHDDTSFFAGALLGSWFTFGGTYRHGKAFGRIFQRETNSEGFTEVPRERRPAHIYRAPAKTR